MSLAHSFVKRESGVELRLTVAASLRLAESLDHSKLSIVARTYCCFGAWPKTSQPTCERQHRHMVHRTHMRACVAELALESVIGRECCMRTSEILLRPRKVAMERKEFLEILQSLLVSKRT